jgi:hypothetical protein
VASALEGSTDLSVMVCEFDPDNIAA